MNKKIISIAVLILLIVLYFAMNFKKDFSPKDLTYNIQGQNTTLKNGFSEVKIDENSATKITTRYFGNEVKSDFDKDGREDVAFLLTQETGGSGIFYYLVVALNKKSGGVGSEAMFIGDRIAPQSTGLSDKGFIIVNYSDRYPGESFAVSPSLAKSLYAKFDPNNLNLGEVVQNFEGESNI